MRILRLIESRLFSKEKSVSPLWSLRHFDGVRTTSPLRRPRLGKTRELRLNFNRVTSLQPREVCVFTSKTVSLQYSQARVWVKQESCVLTLTEPHLFNTVRVVSLLDVRVSSTSDKIRNTTFISTRPVFSLYFYNQFNNILAKAVGNFSRFNSIPTTNSEYRWGLDCVSRHPRWSSLVASKSLTVHSWRSKPNKIKLKVSQKTGSPVLRACCKQKVSKYFETRPS